MMRGLWISAALALCCAALPAQAAEGIECPLEKLAPAERAAIASDFKIASESAEETNPRLDPLMRALDTCAAELRWSADATEAAQKYALATFGIATIGDMLGARGIDAPAIRRYLEQHPELAEAWQDSMIPKLFADLRAAGIKISPDDERPVMGFVGTWGMIQECRKTFARA